jgi:hypothetical protein
MKKFENYTRQMIPMSAIENKSSAFSSNKDLGSEVMKAFKESYEKGNVSKELKTYVEKLSLFKEDNTMANSTGFTATKLAKFIWSKSYDKFQKYYDMSIMYTPAMLGMPEGAGAYQIPKIEGGDAATIEDGGIVPMTDPAKDSVTLTTSEYAIGTNITRRTKLRAAGLFDRILEQMSKGVHRKICSDIANGMVTSAPAATVIASNISYATISQAKKVIRQAVSSTTGALLGLEPNSLILSSDGMYYLENSSIYIQAVTQGQRNVPGKEFDNKYPIFADLDVVTFDLISSTKNAKVVHALVIDRDNFFGVLLETNLETFQGRLPGKTSEEIIMAMDAGFVALASQAAVCITAA